MDLVPEDREKTRPTEMLLKPAQFAQVTQLQEVFKTTCKVIIVMLGTNIPLLIPSFECCIMPKTYKVEIQFVVRADSCFMVGTTKTKTSVLLAFGICVLHITNKKEEDDSV